MINLTSYKVILWDFDGVLMDSMHIRDKGFELVLSDYPKNQVNDLLVYHRKNGGLSRYVKFKYFFNHLRNENKTDDEINQYAQAFSKVMMNNLVDKKLLIQDTLTFVEKNYQKYSMHIVSGSDGSELNQICRLLNIDRYFQSINGSPTPKVRLIKDLIDAHKYDVQSCVLIGDSINDYEAAQANKITFIGYNNEKLKEVSANYYETFVND